MVFIFWRMDFPRRYADQFTMSGLDIVHLVGDYNCTRLPLFLLKLPEAM